MYHQASDLAHSALRAFKSNDLSEFQRLVDVEASVNNLASAMTEDLVWQSDYMCIAMNCSMTALVDAMGAHDPFDLLMLPVKITYKEALRNLVLHRSLQSEDLLMPEERRTCELGEKIPPNYSGVTWGLSVACSDAL